MILEIKNYHQRGEAIIAQGGLPFKYEEEKKDTGMTALAGLPVYMDLMDLASGATRDGSLVASCLPMILRKCHLVVDFGSKPVL